MKNKIFLLFMFIISVFTVNFVSASVYNSDLKLLGKVIYVDPGHGGIG